MMNRKFLLAVLILLLIISSFPLTAYSASITVQQSTVRPGEDITATFSGTDRSNAWIGFYKSDAGDRSYSSYTYVRNSDGTYTVTAPTDFGTYNFRLFNDGGYDQRIAVSQTITVVQHNPTFQLPKTFFAPAENMTVQFAEAPPLSTAWIGLYKTDADDRSYIKYTYLRGTSGSYTLDLPRDEGQYEFRIFQDSGYTRVGTSQSFTISDSATPAPAPDPTPAPVPEPTPAPAPPATGSTSSADSYDSGTRMEWPTVSGALGYRVFRSTTPSELGISVTDFYITALPFIDVNILPNTDYYYTVKPVLREANPLQGVEEELGAAIATYTVRSSSSVIASSGQQSFIVLQIDNPRMVVNGVSAEIDPGRGTTPQIISNRTMVPIRAIVEAMGGSVGWDGSESKITLNAKGNNVEMWLNSRNLRANGTSKTMDVAPVSIGGRTFVPVRFSADNLDAKADWINSTREVVIIF